MAMVLMILFRGVIDDMNGKPIIPPDKNAKLHKGKPIPVLEERDKAIRRIQELQSSMEKRNRISSKISNGDSYVSR